MKSFKKYVEDQQIVKLIEEVGMTSIKHLHQLSPLEFVEIFTSQTPFEMTTKMDGSNWSCGVVNGSTFVKTKKGKPTTNQSDFTKIAKKTGNEIFDGFGRSLGMLQSNGFDEWYRKTKDKHQKVFQKVAKSDNEIDFVIFAELFPAAQVNSLVYNADDIGNGALVVFGFKLIDGSKKGIEYSTSKVPISIMNDFVKTFSNNSDNWKVYYKSSVPLKIDDKLKNELIDFVKTNTVAMKNRKRDPESLLAKSTALGEFKVLMDKFKTGLLSQFKHMPSFLGADEIEGVILRNMDNEMITKIVDVDKFTVMNMKNWQFRKELVNEKGELYKNIIDTVFDNADILLIKQKQGEKIANYLEVKGVYKMDTLEELLTILHDDAKGEVTLSSAKTMQKDMNRLLTDYIKTVEDIIKKTGENQKDPDKKLDEYNYKSSIQNLETEIKLINKFNKELTSIVSGKSAWAKAFEFILGPKVIEELVKKFIK